MHALKCMMGAIFVALLSACTTVTTFDSEEDIKAAYYRAEGPPSLTLVTSINSRNNSGAHSALIINGDQRVVFDPAGSWTHPSVPENSDVLYGMTPEALAGYLGFQAGHPFYAVFQELDVSADIAAQAIAWAQTAKPVAQAACARSISILLRDLGYTQIRQSWFPKALSRDFQTIPGVNTRLIFDPEPEEPYKAPGFTPVESS